MQKIRENFIDNHVAFVYESVCQEEIWQLVSEGRLNINKLGRWWNNREEIDIVGFDSGGDEIIFCECKYRNRPMDVDVFQSLLRKKSLYYGTMAPERKDLSCSPYQDLAMS